VTKTWWDRQARHPSLVNYMWGSRTSPYLLLYVPQSACPLEQCLWRDGLGVWDGTLVHGTDGTKFYGTHFWWTDNVRHRCVPVSWTMSHKNSVLSSPVAPVPLPYRVLSIVLSHLSSHVLVRPGSHNLGSFSVYWYVNAWKGLENGNGFSPGKCYKLESDDFEIFEFIFV